MVINEQQLGCTQMTNLVELLPPEIGGVEVKGK